MTNLTTTYMTTQAERSRLARQAERGWQADQAAATRSRRHVIDAIRRHAGTVLILAGEHLRNVPRRVPAQST